MTEQLLVRLTGAKRVYFAEAWISLDNDGITPKLFGTIQHIKNGPKHRHTFLYIKKGWIKCQN